jgi:hypothetical protein
MGFLGNLGRSLFGDDEEEGESRGPTFRKYDQADAWAAGRARDRYLDPEPPEPPEGTRFHNFNRHDPFDREGSPKAPPPAPIHARPGGVLWDEWDANVVWREPSLSFVEPDKDALNALLAPDPPPPPKHWSEWTWHGGPGRYEAFRWPEDGKEHEGLRYMEDAMQQARRDQIAREVGATFVQPQIDEDQIKQQYLEQRYAAPWPAREGQVIDAAGTEYEARDGTRSGEITLTYYGYTPTQYGQTEAWRPMPEARDWPAELAPAPEPVEEEREDERPDGLWFPYVAPSHDGEEAPEGDDTEAQEAPEPDGRDGDDRAGIGGMLWG